MRKHDTPRAGELYCDTRLAGVKRWYYGKPKDADMRIPRDIVDSVCFLCVKAADGRGQIYDHFIGTAFFASVDTSLTTTFTYLVTAKHVLDDAVADGYRDFYVRLNIHEGASETVRVGSIGEWTTPRDAGIDVAVLPFSPDWRTFKYTPLPIVSRHIRSPFRHENYFLSDDEVGLHDVGIGDDIFVTGFFSHRWGEERNIPVVRSGIIAAMPDEPLEDKDGNRFHAYLAEMRSIGGLSGSPVLILRPRAIPKLDKWEVENYPGILAEYLNTFLHAKPVTHFLGMVRGHWDLKKQGEDSVYREADAREIDRLNTGISSITPAWDIVDLLMGERLMKQREEAEKARRKETAPTQDSTLPRKKAEAEGITHDEMQEALRRASRKTSSQPDSESDET